MGNKKWTRLLALCLAVVCTFSVVAAAGTFQDVNGDGKYTVWDLQALFEADSENYEATLEKVLGGGDELSANDEGVYEIWSELGLRNMAKNASKGYSFKLMANIDLGGKDWTPVKAFKGTFDGNNKIISNFNITKSSSTTDMGFFGVIDHNGTDEDGNKLQSTVKNLNLRNVNIVATSGARYIGLLTGQNRGVIENCTTVGTVTDERDELSVDVYVGAITGRNNNSNPDGIIKGTNGMNVTVNITEESDFTDTTRMVNSKMATFFSELTTESTGSRNVGLAGNSDKGDIQNLDTDEKGDLVWQDITNSTDLADTVLQNRREAVAAEMYWMCTVPWTPTNTMYYYDFDQTDSNGKPYAKSYTTIYNSCLCKGLPYTHGSAGRDQFNEYIGNYTAAEGCWPADSYYFNNSVYNATLNEDYTKYSTTTDEAVKADLLKTYPELAQMTSTVGSTYQAGWSMYIGADCSTQAGWAWRKVSAVSGSGFVNAYGTKEMYPSVSNQSKYGIQPVNGLQLDTPTTDLNGDNETNESDDRSWVITQLVTDYIENNDQTIMEALARTSKGDLLMNYSPLGGHTRVALCDAVVIRNYAGNIDIDQSYIVTAEQGGSGADSDGTNHYYELIDPSKGAVAGNYKWKSTCCVDRRMTFAGLTTEMEATYSGYTQTFYPAYIPITCDALRNADSKAGEEYLTVNMDASGNVTSNFHIVSVTVNDGEPKYTSTVQINHRKAYTSVTVEASAGDDVTVRLANGKSYAGKFGTPGLTEVK